MSVYPVRLAVVGCGAAARQCHLPGLLREPSVSLVAAVDPNVDNARYLAAEHRRGGGASDVAVTDDLRSLEGCVDAAVVAAPHRHHADLAIELLDMQIACLVEKPFAMTAEECERMAAARGSTVLAAAHVRRLFPAAQWVRKVMRQGTLGEVRTVSWLEGAPYDWPLVSPSLFDANASGGGVLADTGPHVIDMVLWWLNAETPAALRSADTSRGGAESEVHIALRCNDVLVELEFSRLRVLRNTCLITGSDATLEVGIDQEANYALRSSDGLLLEAGPVPVLPPSQLDWEELFAEQLRNFAAASLGRENIYADWTDGLRVVRTIEECYRRMEHSILPWNQLAHA